ncbi:MAG: gamma-glutamylcyclotransferase, partial [Proteobacteria bacterium]|nr:gamma-glutamylcyclotransferase [Pseudomonadota bacterium]
GSGKANIVESPDNITWGVVYEIPLKALIKGLDTYEKGYERKVMEVYMADGNHVTAEVWFISR